MVGNMHGGGLTARAGPHDGFIDLDYTSTLRMGRCPPCALRGKVLACVPAVQEVIGSLLLGHSGLLSALAANASRSFHSAEVFGHRLSTQRAMYLQ